MEQVARGWDITLLPSFSRGIPLPWASRCYSSPLPLPHLCLSSSSLCLSLAISLPFLSSLLHLCFCFFSSLSLTPTISPFCCIPREWQVQVCASSTARPKPQSHGPFALYQLCPSTLKARNVLRHKQGTTTEIRVRARILISIFYEWNGETQEVAAKMST